MAKFTKEAGAAVEHALAQTRPDSAHGAPMSEAEIAELCVDLCVIADIADRDGQRWSASASRKVAAALVRLTKERADRDAEVARLRDAETATLGALKAICAPMEALRDDMASRGLPLGGTHAARTERQRMLLTWIEQNADEVDDALEGGFAAIAVAEARAALSEAKEPGPVDTPPICNAMSAEDDEALRRGVIPAAAETGVGK